MKGRYKELKSVLKEHLRYTQQVPATWCFFSRINTVSIAKVLVGRNDSFGKIKTTETWEKSGQ